MVHSLKNKKQKKERKEKKKKKLFLVHLPWQRTFPKSMVMKITVSLQITKNKQTEKRSWKMRMGESISFLSFVAVTSLLFYFIFALFWSYFETRNTKLPETAQFTQAPQSTTAFKLSLTAPAFHSRQGNEAFLCSIAASPPPHHPPLLFFFLLLHCSCRTRMEWMFTQGNMASCMYVQFAIEWGSRICCHSTQKHTHTYSQM